MIVYLHVTRDAFDALLHGLHDPWMDPESRHVHDYLNGDPDVYDWRFSQCKAMHGLRLIRYKLTREPTFTFPERKCRGGVFLTTPIWRDPLG